MWKCRLQKWRAVHIDVVWYKVGWLPFPQSRSGLPQQGPWGQALAGKLWRRRRSHSVQTLARTWCWHVGWRSGPRLLVAHRQRSPKESGIGKLRECKTIFVRWNGNHDCKLLSTLSVHNVTSKVCDIVYQMSTQHCIFHEMILLKRLF